MRSTSLQKVVEESCDGERVRFAPARREDDFAWISPDRRGDLFSCSLHGVCGLQAHAVQVAGIAELLHEVWAHRVKHIL